MVSYSPDERTVLSMSVYQTLRTWILDQVFTPGERLNIDALATKLKVSPTPVREALVRLTAERLVNFVAYKGYTVTPLLSLREVTDLLAVRKLLEAEAARQAAVRIGLLDLHSMARWLTSMTELGSSLGFAEFRTFNQLDKQFHETLVGAADNAILLETYRSLNIHVQLARFYYARGVLNMDDSMTEHQAIYNALKMHDADAAVQAVIRHIDSAYIRTVEPLITSANGSTGTKK